MSPTVTKYTMTVLYAAVIALFFSAAAFGYNNGPASRVLILAGICGVCTGGLARLHVPAVAAIDLRPAISSTRLAGYRAKALALTGGYMLTNLAMLAAIAAAAYLLAAVPIALWLAMALIATVAAVLSVAVLAQNLSADMLSGVRSGSPNPDQPGPAETDERD